MIQPGISVVIRTKTDQREIFDVLDRLARQTLAPREVIVIDSGSAPAIAAELRRRIGAGFLAIAPEAYSSARALNLALERATGGLAAILSQDVLPASDSYLEILASSFDSERVAAAYARQAVKPSAAHPLNEKDFAKTYPPEPRLQTADCWMDNACSMIRMDLWRRRRFLEQAAVCEDHEWAQWAIGQGFAIRYQAAALALHGHRRSVRGAWRRHIQEGQGLAWVHSRPLSLRRAIFCCVREMASDTVWLTRRGLPWWIPYAIAERAAKHAALWLGWRNGRRAFLLARPRANANECEK